MIYELILLLSLLACPQFSIAWGKQGHIIVADIAQELLTPEAKALSSFLLNQPVEEVRLSSVATWADEINFISGYKFAKTWHYVNQPPQTSINQCSYKADRDCPVSGCIDSAIRNYTARASDRDRSLPWKQQNEAFMFLIHFIGDLHQPLHTGFTIDKGGNLIEGKFFNAQTNLHSLWDSKMIKHGLSRMYNNDQPTWTEHLVREAHNTPNTTLKEWLACPKSDIVNGVFVPCTGKWTNESARIVCETAYQSDDQTFLTKETGFQVGEEYFDRNWPVIETQLIKGGVRLAYTINTIAQLDPDFSGPGIDNGEPQNVEEEEGGSDTDE